MRIHEGHKQVEGGGVNKGGWEGSVCATPSGAAPALAAVTIGVGVVVVGATPRTNKGQCEQVQTSRPGAQQKQLQQQQGFPTFFIYFYT